jgi:cell division transport system permease protein
MFINSLKEAIKNILTQRRLTITAVTVIYVCVFLVCLVATIWSVVSYSVRYLDSQMQIVILLNKSVDNTQKDIIVSKLQNIENVKEVLYVNGQEGKQKTLAAFEFDNQFIENTNNIDKDKVNFDRIIVYTKSSKQYPQTIKNIKLLSFNEEGQFDKVIDRFGVVEKLKNIELWMRIIGLAFIALFVIVSSLVMANVFQIVIYNHRQEIEIQRLVGATNSYIRLPFVVQALLYYILVAILIMVSVIPVIWFLLPNVKNFLKQDALANEMNMVIYGSYFGILIICTIIGVLTTFVSINRYLKK